MSVLIPYLHYLFIMVMMGSLITEHILLKPKMDRERIKNLALTDLIYGISAILVLVTGLLRFFYYGKGVDYYLANPYFHSKLTIFVLLGIISIYPTIHFLRWRRLSASDNDFNPELRMVKRFTMILRIELFLVAIMPLLAVLLNRGYGM